jgi:hypothetical protein
MSPVSEFLSAHALKEKKVDPLLLNPEYSHFPAKIHIFPPKCKIPPKLFLERKMYFNWTFPVDSSNCQWDFWIGSYRLRVWRQAVAVFLATFCPGGGEYL